MRTRRRGVRVRPQVDRLDDRCLLSGLTPAQVTAAYGLSAITFTSSGKTVPGNGSGETIALIEAYNDPTIASDLHTFDVAYNLPDPTLKVESQSGTAVPANAATNSGWTEEESLDVEWAHAIAPGANILVVEANSQNIQDLLAAVDTARSTPGVVAVSMSWGFSETPGETSYDSNFTTPAGHQGITFIASSGDNGSMAGASYPAASPNVLSVGGSTLLLSSTGAYQSESAWTDSGGGYSQYEPEPSYQAKIQTTGSKATPDVAFDGDPNTGVQVYVTESTRFGGSQGTWMTIGGTSVGSPSWAGIIAIVDQGRALAGLGSLDGPTQTLPALYTAPSSGFHTVAAASSPFSGGFGYGYGYGYGAFQSFGGSGLGVSSSTTSTSTGANTATGLGTPIGPALVSDLVSSTLTTPLTPVTGSGGSAPTPTRPTSPVGGGSGHHHRLTHSGSRKVKSGKTRAEAPARSHHVAQVAVPTRLSPAGSLRA
jgi:subtilase family serine protease